MMSCSFHSSIIASFFLILSLCFGHMTHGADEQKTYIVHMAISDMPPSFDLHSNWYESTLKSVSETAEMLYTYKNAINGFSTRLTPEEADTLVTQPGVIYVLPEQRHQLHTTRTPLFLGLDKQSENLLAQTGASSSSDVIIGVIDTGVWPERKSFSDEGYGQIPSRWKGECESGTNFNSSLCNRKLIGARFFCRGYEAALGQPVNETIESRSPRDDVGHGTHTSSTVVGSAVEGANLLGFANGTAHGMAPRARLALYKVCWRSGFCGTSDILAGMDKAIEDKVDIMSLSLGLPPGEYYLDPVAIGAFAAVEQGIFVSCAAGNDGSMSFTVSNAAPWITTVGASSIDRNFPGDVTLGNGKNYSGVSLYKGDPLPNKLLPLVYAGNVSNGTTYGNLCFPGTLIPEKVKGKIVLCDKDISTGPEIGVVVKEAGALGMILANTDIYGEELFAEAFLLPATAVGEKVGDIIRDYVLTDPNPTASILFEGTIVNVKPSPMVTAFSSRGPNKITPGILKPDLIAPGLNILAAWTGATGPTSLEFDVRRVEFNIISGTSMSCPHVSGLAALLKAAHPDWSPAAIRSALMTTAYITDKDGKPILDTATGKPSTPFDHGAGHVSPVSAMDPGLIYDLTAEDYFEFLCASNYNSSQMRALSGRDYKCEQSKTYSVANLNYPSFAVKVNRSGAYNYTRTVTSVGGAGTYSVKASSEAVKIAVEPAVLDFKETNDKQSYTVTFTVDSVKASVSNGFGSIEWSDGKHVVASPVAIMWS